jgi:hypothetical protein
MVEVLNVDAYRYTGDDFFGFTGTLIDKVVFNVAGDQLALIDNAAFNNTSAAPEPATMLLFGTGIAGLIAARRKKTV